MSHLMDSLLKALHSSRRHRLESSLCSSMDHCSVDNNNLAAYNSSAFAVKYVALVVKHVALAVKYVSTTT